MPAGKECNGVKIWHRGWGYCSTVIAHLSAPLIIPTNANETKPHDQSLFRLKESNIYAGIMLLGVIITYLQCKYTSFPTCTLSYLHLDVSNQPPVTREDQLAVSPWRLHFDIATEPVVFHPELLFLQSDHEDGAQWWRAAHLVFIHLLGDGQLEEALIFQTTADICAPTAPLQKSSPGLSSRVRSLSPCSPSRVTKM